MKIRDGESLTAEKNLSVNKRDQTIAPSLNSKKKLEALSSPTSTFAENAYFSESPKRENSVLQSQLLPLPSWRRGLSFKHLYSGLLRCTLILCFRAASYKNLNQPHWQTTALKNSNPDLAHY